MGDVANLMDTVGTGCVKSSEAAQAGGGKTAPVRPHGPFRCELISYRFGREAFISTTLQAISFVPLFRVPLERISERFSSRSKPKEDHFE